MSYDISRRMQNKYRKYNTKKLICTLLDNISYKGWTGYNEDWGEYIGILGTMVYYLKFINQVEFAKMDVLLKSKNKRGATRLTEDEIKELIYRVWKVLDYDLQRKFEKYVMFMDKDYKRYYNIGR